MITFGKHKLSLFVKNLQSSLLQNSTKKNSNTIIDFLGIIHHPSFYLKTFERLDSGDRDLLCRMGPAESGFYLSPECIFYIKAG